MAIDTVPLPRTLAAILYADAVGFSRMTEADEDNTYRKLRDIMDVFTATVESHGGLIMNYAGDAVLAMFGSAVDALICAANMQKFLHDLHEGFPPEHTIAFRIGLNLGDVIEDRDDVFGDGVNVAARLEGIAEPGGICISGSFFDAIGQKLPFDYESIGEQQVKNLSKPIRAYHARLIPGSNIPVVNPGRIIRAKKDSRRVIPRISRPALLGIVTALVIASVVYVLKNGSEESTIESSDQSQATMNAKLNEQLDDAKFRLETPSLAVLPFTNISNDPSQEYFVDGLTDDLITELSKISGLLVISRISAFQYKGISKDIREIAKELGTRYMLEGSARRVEGRVRINAQLIEASSGNHLWAERYDGEIGNIFDFQDEIIKKISVALKVQLTEGESLNIDRKLTSNVDAYDYYLRGKEKFFLLSKDDNSKARSYFEQAIQHDPEFADAYAMLGWTHVFEYMNGWSKNPDISLDLALKNSREALKRDQKLTLAYFVGGLVKREKGDWDGALRYLEEAIALDSNYANAHVLLATLLYFAGRPEEGLKRMQKAIRLEPHHPYNYPFHLGQAYFILKQYAKAIDTFQEALDRNPLSDRVRVWLAAALAKEGKQDEAEWEVSQVLIGNPDFSLKDFLEAFPFRKSKDRNHFLSGLQMAGFK
ncbi:MAG: hypothetical protein BMS9Abin25_1207 [Gammaproteobacteria bacterium]|nr:MAG: hypothetical protein BMS9Abin25_1207 [Gammaproteobacteria bacterium]